MAGRLCAGWVKFMQLSKFLFINYTYIHENRAARVMLFTPYWASCGTPLQMRESLVQNKYLE